MEGLLRTPRQSSSVYSPPSKNCKSDIVQLRSAVYSAFCDLCHSRLIAYQYRLSACEGLRLFTHDLITMNRAGQTRSTTGSVAPSATLLYLLKHLPSHLFRFIVFFIVQNRTIWIRTGISNNLRIFLRNNALPICLALLSWSVYVARVTFRHVFSLF